MLLFLLIFSLILQKNAKNVELWTKLVYNIKLEGFGGYYDRKGNV